MNTERLLLVAHMQIKKLEEELESAKKAEAKAAAFDWLIARMQEAYDQGGWMEVGDVSIGAHTIWGHREECLMKAEIQWKDRRDEPLDLLAAINQSIAQAGGAA